MVPDGIVDLGYHLLYFLTKTLTIMNDVEIGAKTKMAQINIALGVFISIFGVIVIVAMAYTETWVQQMTDLTAGLVLTSIGAGMIWKSKRTLRKFKTKNKEYKE